MISATVREYDETSVTMSSELAVRLRDAAGTALSVELGERVEPAGGESQWVLRANSQVGTIRVGDDIEIKITPKVAIRNVMFLLVGATMPSGWLRDAFTGYQAAPDAVAALSMLYARMMDEVLARGPQRDYRQMEEERVTLRGRIDMARQVRRPWRVSPIASRYVDYTEDIDRNRYVKHAARLLLRTLGVPITARRQLRHNIARLDLVGDDIPPIDLPDRMVFTRINRAYEPLLRLAKVIREAQTLGHQRGGLRASTFLLDMNRLFESYVEHAVRNALEGRCDVVGQDGQHLDVDRRVRMKPDLLLRDSRSRGPLHVADMKYKISGDERGRNADYYQMLAYTTAYGLDSGTLLYAQLGDGVDLGEVTVRRTGTRLRTLPVDLTGGPDDIKASVHAVAHRLLADPPPQPQLSIAA